MSNQYSIRRQFRNNFADSVIRKLDKALKRYDLSKSDFARLMTRNKLGVYRRWPNCFRRISDLYNGRFPSDEFCTNIINVINRIEKDPTVLNKYMKRRVGFQKDTVVGQSVNSREAHFNVSDNQGYKFARRLLRKAIRENS